MKRTILTLCTFLFAILIFGKGDETNQDYEFRYHTYLESTKILSNLAKQYPELVKMYSIGKTATGQREIWCMEITNQRKGKAEFKPACFFDANQHDIEVATGEVTLYLCYYLLKNYNKDSIITHLIDSRVIYVIQRSDPDGADAFINGKIDWNPADIKNSIDLDNDGRIGEDGNEDINGDGHIVMMRRQDPFGPWKPHPDDSRIMITREETDTLGPFYTVINEGIDNDNDGKINEDPPVTRFISNRNYPAFWSNDDGVFRGSGDYPLQEHNSRILVEFIVSKPNISILESFHTATGVLLRPYAAKPDIDIPSQDLSDYQAVLSRGTEMTGYYNASIYSDFSTIIPDIPWEKQPYTRRGVFLDWAYGHLGIFSTTTELWSLESILNEVGWAEIPREKPLFATQGQYFRPDVQVQLLKWLDIHKNDPNLNGHGFIDWKPFKHPTLGDVEIGGFTKYILFNPPPGSFLQKTIEDQVDFAIYRIGITSLVKILSIDIQSKDQDNWEITTAIGNVGYLDTSTQQARKMGISKCDELSVGVVNGKVAENLIINYPMLRGTRGSPLINQYKNTFKINAPKNSKVVITIRSEKGGSDTKEIYLDSI